jgi:hypothetical protein
VARRASTPRPSGRYAQPEQKELGPDYFGHARADQVRRRSIHTLERLGYHVTLTPLPAAACEPVAPHLLRDSRRHFGRTCPG